MSETPSTSQTADRDLTPTAEFAAQANAKADLYDAADADFEGFWADQARQRLSWAKDFDQTLDWSGAPFAKWYVGGELNAAYNCVDRHVEAGNGDRVAIHFEGEGGDTRTITYADLQRDVAKAANALESLGVAKGDRVAIYLPMIPEAVAAMLACARIGAPHSVVFGGFSADALRTRIADAEAKVVITADGQFRRGKTAPLKPAVDDAVTGETTVEKVLVVQRTKDDVDWDDDRDVWWHDVVDAASDQHEAVAHDSEHPLFILYTSGTTGKPKGIFHTTGRLPDPGGLHELGRPRRAPRDRRLLVHRRHRLGDRPLLHRLRPAGQRRHPGHLRGHARHPAPGPLVGDRPEVRVTILYTAPTAIRTFMKWGDDIPAKFDLSSLRLLGSVGEPINPEAWLWYRKHIGGGQLPRSSTPGGRPRPAAS